MAIILVYGSHFGPAFSAPPKIERLPFIVDGWSGVDLFFILSGLLIGTQLWRELKSTGQIQLGRFLLRRGARIWPLYFSFVLVIVFLILFAHHRSTGIWADLTFLSNYVTGQLNVGWSLSTEEQFSIIAPLLLIVLSAIKIDIRGLWLLPIVIFLALPVSRFLAMREMLAVHGSIDHNVPYFPIHLHADGLVIGLLLAYGAVFRPQLLASSRFRIVAACILTISGVVLYKLSHFLFNFTALALIFGSATLLGLAYKGTSWIVNWRGFYVISRLSYGIYLNHCWVLDRFGRAFARGPFHSSQLALWFCYFVGFAISSVIAAVTFQLIEWPFLNLRSRWQASTRSRPAPAPASSAA